MEMLFKIFFSLVLVGLFSLLACLYYVLWLGPERNRERLRRQGIRGPPPCFPYGNILEMKQCTESAEHKPPEEGKSFSHNYAPTLFPYFEQWRKRYGPIFMYSLRNVLVLYVNDPDLVKEIGLSTSLDLGKPSHLQQDHKPLFGQGILRSNGPSWYYQRKIIAPEFFMDKVKVVCVNHSTGKRVEIHMYLEGWDRYRQLTVGAMKWTGSIFIRSKRVLGMVDLMVESAIPLLKSWESKIDVDNKIGEIRVDEDLRNFSSIVISRACFGSSYSKGKEILLRLRALQNAMHKAGVFTGIPILRHIPTQKNRHIWRLEKEIRSLILDIVKEHKEGDKARSEKDLLPAILEEASLSQAGPDAATRFIVDNCKNIYFAGYETTAVTSTWCLMLLALNPDWQARVRNEVIDICRGQTPDAEMIRRMKTLTMVIQETLRLYPPATFVPREALQEMKIGGIQLPKGINLWISVPTLHQDPYIWGSDASEFNPERFARGTFGACKLPQVYIPFGLGSRTCLGQNFAMMEMKVLLCMILPKFNFSLSPKYCHSPAYRMVVEPEHGLYLHIKRV